ncbi:hypothetical protein MY1884_009150 [Beauveria asiatica]
MTGRVWGRVHVLTRGFENSYMTQVSSYSSSVGTSYGMHGMLPASRWKRQAYWMTSLASSSEGFATTLMITNTKPGSPILRSPQQRMRRTS